LRIIINQARCKKCGDLVVSRDVDLYVRCKCGAIAVSGGERSIMRLGHHNDIEELSQKAYDK